MPFPVNARPARPASAAWLVRPWEEADLERRFGEPYRRYRASVRCWWPGFGNFARRGD